MQTNGPVEIPKSHRNEWKSKRSFEELIEGMSMYMPFGWAIRDYGIDGQVEIMRQIEDSDSFRPESKYYLLQLKSKETTKIIKNQISFSVPVKKIIQWYSSNLPVMFVLNDLESNTFYFQWIDEILIAAIENVNSNWLNQEDITLKIPVGNNFKFSSLDSIRDYVLNWKIPSRKIILPGTYFELKSRCNKNLLAYATISKPFKFESIENSIKSLNNQIEQAIYRIALTGPSRVGKSSLINALLRRRDVSPTGIFQTTGVPIQILPANRDFLTITFKNGTTVTKDFSKDIIEDYASQKKNEDNKLSVALLSIHLANRQLEQGVSFFDIPGLDDPDENIYNYTWSTVTKSNAILYLIDASPFENGGYIFRNEYKKHILELGQSLDKIFLVFTKINALSGNKLQLLQDRVIKDLKKHHLYDKVSEKIYFISAEESLNARLKKKGSEDTVELLENDIWSYLLKENKTGLVNLNFVYREILNSTKDFEGILNTRLLDNNKRKQLVAAIDLVKQNVPKLSNLYYSRENEIKRALLLSLSNHKNNYLIELERYLNSIPISGDLPNKKALQNYLTQGAYKAMEQTNIEYAHQVNLLKEIMDQWIETNLKQVREIISSTSDSKLVDFSEVENFDTPAVNLSTSFGVGLITGIIGFIINPAGAIVAGIAGFFGNLLLSSAERRAKRIGEIMSNARKCYNEQFLKIDAAYLDLVKDHSILIIAYANDKINYFFKDLKIQLDKLGGAISEIELAQYQSALQMISKLRSEIKKDSLEITSWYEAI